MKENLKKSEVKKKRKIKNPLTPWSSSKLSIELIELMEEVEWK